MAENPGDKSGIRRKRRRVGYSRRGIRGNKEVGSRMGNDQPRNMAIPIHRPVLSSEYRGGNNRLDGLEPIPRRITQKGR